MLTLSYIKFQKAKGIAIFAHYIREKMRNKSHKKSVMGKVS